MVEAFLKLLYLQSMTLFGSAVDVHVISYTTLCIPCTLSTAECPSIVSRIFFQAASSHLDFDTGTSLILTEGVDRSVLRQ